MAAELVQVRLEEGKKLEKMKKILAKHQQIE